VHIWDVDLTLFTTQRKLILAIEILFVLTTGLVKVSILLFFRRLGSRGVSKAFRITTWVAIGFTIASTIAFFISPLVGCAPISAYWEQSDVINIALGVKFNCNNEGAAITAAGVISTVQDLITALLPNFIYWKAQIPFRQKAALMGIFATAYGAAAFGALRTYSTWVLFYETYDVSWQLWEIWNWTILEFHIGVICANAPALKVFLKRYLNIKSTASEQQAQSSKAKSSQTKGQTSTNTSGKSRAKLAIWKSPYANHGYYSQPTQFSVDELGGVHVSEELEETTSDTQNTSANLIQSERHCANDDDVELGIFVNAANYPSQPPEAHRESRDKMSIYLYDDLSECGTISGGGYQGFRHLRVEV
jgi:hypothetical protein